MTNKKIIDECVKCYTKLSTVDLIEEGCISYFDKDGHLHSMSNGKNILRCPKCFNQKNSDVVIRMYPTGNTYLTLLEAAQEIEALREHHRFFGGT